MNKKEKLKMEAPKNHAQPGLDKAKGQLKLVITGKTFNWEEKKPTGIKKLK